ncbi:aspartate-semialdehyde dehydrogenase [Paludibacterium paludis]|uniref:Aspartate-semialdehyde dehydrogenase n=1 Tax=Paludibacterium paludis TaxID=1225769 RepID=A0A918NZC9_9NEIS|nr:aspartate-semialdehyde dehydrogenase [Paludibacterium paludis]GGY06804.1 aspartate-semialdehyde dehydrogenase [Paludibacterium paludis]
MSRMIPVAVVGATGLVGQAVLDLLAERQFPASRVFAVDAGEQDGQTVSFGNIELDVHDVEDFAFDQVRLAIFVAGADVSRRFVPEAGKAGVAVIDFSGAYRLDGDIPLIVPEVNGDTLADWESLSLVSLPNCTVAPLARALKALEAHGLSRITVSTYQSVSGSGQAAMEELANQTTALFNQRESDVAVYPKRIAFNLLPAIGAIGEDGVSDEERSLMLELPRLLGRTDLIIEAMCVRVPVFFGHAWSVHVETATPPDADRARKLFAAVGLHVVDEPSREDGFATPMEVAGSEDVWVSRVRATPRGLAFWVVADNVRAGAARNAVRVAERLLADGRLD